MRPSRSVRPARPVSGPPSGPRPWLAPAVWIEAARPRTLPAAVAPVLVASALAWRDDLLDLVPAAVCLVFALLVQIGTNFANDYYDFIKGADTAERVGPRRAVAAGLIPPVLMWRAMVGVLVAAFMTGLTLLPYGGWPLLGVGVASVACAVLYTGGPYPLAYKGLGDVFVFIFFGLVAVGATYFVQVGEVSTEAVWLGVGVGALAANILVVNNYRDVETDARAGKRTLVVRWGRGWARVQFALSHAVAVVAVLAVGESSDWEETWLFGVAAAVAVMGVWQTRQLARARDPATLIRLLGATGRWLAGYALLVSAALYWA